MNSERSYQKYSPENVFQRLSYRSSNLYDNNSDFPIIPKWRSPYPNQSVQTWKWP